MRLALVHLSDIHFRADRDNPLLEFNDVLVGAVHSEVSGCDAVVLTITGDVAFSGKPEEYTIAADWLRQLRNGLAKRGVTLKATIGVPGNHDCDFGLATDVRDVLLQSATVDPSSDIVKACTELQAPYQSFAEEHDVWTCSKDGLVGVHQLVLFDREIVFHAYNSAWMSSIRESPGQMRAPVELIKAKCTDGVKNDGLDAPDLMVWLMHHPYGWLDPDNSKELRKHIEKFSDVIVTGHEHVSEAFTRTYPTGDRVDYVEGGVLQEGPGSKASSFNVIVVDLGEKQQRVTTFSLENGAYVPSGGENWVPFVRNRRRLGGLYEFNEDFQKHLDDPGATFSHPRVARLRLSDLFVYPDLQDLPVTGRKKGELIGDLPGYILSRRRVVIVGEEKSGKSSLAKRTVADLRTRDVLPLLASGAEFAPKNIEKMKRGIRKLFVAQYSKDRLDKFMALAPKYRGIVIDDYHRVRLTKPARARMLDALEDFFGTVVLLASNDVRLEYLSQAGEKASTHPIFDYSHAELLQLGHRRRHDVVARWYSLGRDLSDSQVVAALQREAIKAEESISNLIGKGLVPSYPLFVLILLQQLEAGRNHDTSAGSQGYLYHTLIVTALSKVAKRPHEIDSRINYLTELARFFRTEELDSIDADTLAEWHRAYCDRQLIKASYPSYVEELVSVGLLRRSEDHITFGYPYIEFFFVARFLKSHLHDSAIRDEVVELARSVHLETNATIMLFLSHLSSDPFVLDTMIEAAASLFEDQPEWNTDRQTKYLNELVAETPTLALGDRTVEENRNEELEKRDRAEAVSESSPWEDDPDAFDEEIRPILMINSAFKTIQIIGQILRNYPGSLDGKRKVELADHCYRLGLRVLHYLYSVMESHGEDFLKAIIEYVSKLRPESRRHQVTMEANSVLFALCERMAFGVIRHVSQSVGLEELSPVYREVERLGESRTPFRLIDLSIKLDHNRSTPAEQAIRLYEDERRNTLVATIIRRLVWYHLYLFPSSYKVRQRLCEKLSIDNNPKFLRSETKLLKG
ncbi:MAG: metallophosphoesterase [Myxococcota bacterium]